MHVIRLRLIRLISRLQSIVGAEPRALLLSLLFNSLRFIFIWGWWLLSFFKYSLIRWTFLGGIFFVMGAVVSYGLLSFLGGGPDLTSVAEPPDTSNFEAIVTGLEEALDKPVNRESYPQNFEPLTDFDTRGWKSLPPPQFTPGNLDQATNWPSFGETSLHLSIDDIDLVPDSNGGTLFRTGIELAQPLHRSEDWTSIQTLSLQINLAEFLHVTPLITLCLANQDGSTACFESVDQERFKAWGDVVSFPLMEEFLADPLDEDMLQSVLVDVVMLQLMVELPVDEAWATQYDPQNPFDLYVSDLVLDGNHPWDQLSGIDFEWEVLGDVSGIQAGISNETTFQNGAGALHVQWMPTDFSDGVVAPDRVQINPTVAVANWAEVLPPERRNWDEYIYIEGMVWSSEENLPLEFEIWDGESSVRTVTGQVREANRWEKIVWKIPARQPGFRYDAVEGLTLVMPDVERFPSAEYWLDQLRVGRSIYIPHAVEVRPGYRANAIEWEQPIFSGIETVQVVASRSDYPLTPIDGESICVVPISEPGLCDHTGLSRDETWFYTLFSADRYAYRTVDGASQGVGDQALYRFRPPNGTFEAGFDLDNGSLLYVVDLETRETLVQGGREIPLWQIDRVASDPTTLLSSPFSISAERFGPDPGGDAYFSVDTGQDQMVYRFQTEGGELIELYINLRFTGGDGLVFDIEMVNEGLHPITKLTLPGLLRFETDSLEQVYLPLSEGVALQNSFFRGGRMVLVDRPGDLMADVVAVDLDRKTIGLFFSPKANQVASSGDLVPGHRSDQPIIQPARWMIGGEFTAGISEISLGFPIYVPPGGQWEGPALNYRLVDNVETVLEEYVSRRDAGLDQGLENKLARAGLDLDRFATLPIYRLNLQPWSIRSGVDVGDAWALLGQQLDSLVPGPAIINMTHWQYGRDWYADPDLNHLIDDNLPDRLPIWWNRYGDQNRFYDLLDQLDQDLYLTTPSIDPTVWNGYDPQTREVIGANNSAIGLRNPSRTQPVYEAERGIVVEPWNRIVQGRHDALLETFQTEIPQDLLVIESTNAHWRYAQLGEGGAVSSRAYAQGLINEVARMGETTPIIAAGLHDQLGGAVFGFSDSLWAAQGTQRLDRFGTAYEDWIPFPLAAYLLNGETVFYPPLQSDTLSLLSPETSQLSHFLLFGYSLAADLGPYLTGDSQVLTVVYHFQRAVASQTMGGQLLSFDQLEEDRSIFRSRWARNGAQIEIMANLEDEGVHNFEGYGIAPHGFMARTPSDQQIAGLFVDRFNGVPLAPGVHALVIDHREADQIEIYHPMGPNTLIEIDRPIGWDESQEILVRFELSDGRVIVGRPQSLSTTRIGVNLIAEYEGSPVKRLSIAYGLELEEEAEAFVSPVLQPLTPIIVGGPLSPIQPDLSEDIDQSSNAESPLLRQAEPLSATVPLPLVNGLVLTDTIAAELPPFEFEADVTQYGWTSDIGVVTILPGNRVTLQEAFETGAYSRMETGRFEIEMRPDLTLDIWVSDLSPGASYTLQIQEDEAPYQTFDLLQSNQPERVAINLQALTGWRGERSFRLIVWVSGEGGVVELSRFALNAGPDEEGLTQLDIEKASSNPVLWEERFGPLDHIWQPTDLVTSIQPDGTMGLATTDQGFGKLESEIIEANLSVYSELGLTVIAVEPGARYVVQLLEEGGLYRAYDLYEGDFVGEQRFDLAEVTGWEGEKTFRLLLWVIGETGRMSVDSVKIRSNSE